jgi:hypothetical protein
MKNVYVFTKGSYDDYAIEAIFSSRKKAIDFVKSLNPDPKSKFTWEDAWIETWPVDTTPMKPYTGRAPHKEDVLDILGLRR